MTLCFISNVHNRYKKRGTLHALAILDPNCRELGNNTVLDEFAIEFAPAVNVCIHTSARSVVSCTHPFPVPRDLE